MPKKKEPTGAPVTKESKTPTKVEKPVAAPSAVKSAAETAKPAEAAKPAAAKPAETTTKAPEKPVAPAPAPTAKPSLINGEDAGGQWVGTSAAPSTGGAFNAISGSFNPTLQAPGTYTFAYRLSAADPCPDQETQVSVIVEPAPVADAGQDQTLTCILGMAILGGSSTSTGQGITYSWTFGNTWRDHFGSHCTFDRRSSAGELYPYREQ